MEEEAVYINALKYYKNNIEKSKSKISNMESNISKVGWSRLVIVIIMIALGYFLYSKNSLIPLILLEVLLIASFIVVATYHNKLINKKEKLERFLEINEKGVKRINGEFKSIEDDGSEYINDSHPFSSDIDIFGKSSLFQLINDTLTKGGREKLVKSLSLEKLPSKEEIQNKQKGIEELGKKIEWRQELLVRGKSKLKSKKREVNELEALLKWSNSTSKKNGSKKLIAYIFIALTFASIVAAILKFITPSYVLLFLMINFGVIKLLTKDYKEDLLIISDIKGTVKSYSEILKMIEDEEFDSEYLKDIKKKLNNSEGISCSEEMKKLSNLLDWVGDSSSNAYYLILNILIFSDVFIMENLEGWKKKNSKELENWLDVMSEIDSLVSISNLYFDFEDWNFPSISQKKEIRGKKIGHPLIGERAVRNDYSLSDGKRVTLITGSNMSGKSTFLRTVGLNLLLAYIGAPVYSEEFTCGIFNIYTCMRTKDNLEESISSFYAEILRIKILIEATKRGEDVFFLLDEIFKGTNSVDRHTGATELINQLIDGGAMGLVSTHDLELCDLEEHDSRIENYNFREYYENNKIKFDYKLRKGKSETQNAIHLMKLAGIEFK
ncbi:MAG: DNA mismatch repair protein MutS [Clostridium baratii]|uniref:MutS-related protein n=2 Tax=Clostridium baratii TaxID=1561 RepID=UPI0006C40D80|nr:MutS family DNA mismatch repair protein [Clostridium baratii]MBS6005443.1 DNA mismatch repair protein MutS [Clostridium baratii]MDU1052509.1 DNA mismatch repair protein MutS [Clostridium baratii]MDU4909999.1 DNA mismatch repair protein MutS [Clostridium baratii]CUP35316.1 DNA mismatch repair protein MutS [Clostridium baratii]